MESLLSLLSSSRRALGRLFPGRFRVAGIVLAVYLGASLLTRLALAAFNGEARLFAPWNLVPALAIGALYDLASGVWWMLPFSALAWAWPDGPRSRVPFATAALVLAGAAFATLAFVSGAELVFWHEFASRFNFIAVDYLVYSNEVIGNIRESYALAPIFAAVAAFAAAMLALAWKPIVRASASSGMSFGRRTAASLVFTLAPGVAFLSVEASLKEFTDDAPAVQLAGNGPWEFWHAFRHNEIDYPQFYLTVPIAQAYQTLREEFEHADRPVRFTGNAAMPVEREVSANRPERRLNVVLVSVESLSADFLGTFGNTRGITPNLDRLAAEGLLFTHLYATGTRTVRGLEALALSLPPTPGHSVVKRPNNEHLFTIGEVFTEKGYESLFLYGGYGYFDNMNYFFSNNGYTAIDRSALASAEVHYENIWGVADEDLFTLTLRELDARHASGRPFFAHVMTTSNHRPYSYPAGRIDIPSGTGRDGAVKYTDWALGDFIARARAKPWFDDTVFVVVADHCAAARGRSDLPLDRFHIPMLIYAPKHVPPGAVETVASQIDVAPTILALLGFGYRSRFFGQDILSEGQTHQRALMANYQTVGYLEDGMLVELRPRRRARVVDAESGRELPQDAHSRHLVDEAVGYYEAASDAFRTGALHARPWPRRG